MLHSVRTALPLSSDTDSLWESAPAVSELPHWLVATMLYSVAQRPTLNPTSLHDGGRESGANKGANQGFQESIMMRIGEYMALAEQP